MTLASNATLIPVTIDGVTQQITRADFVGRLLKQDSRDQMINHAALGICGEAGELADCIKNHIHYRQPLNRTNLIEELGDLEFYIQAVKNLFNISDEQVNAALGEKLGVRYAGLKYSDTAAAERADKSVACSDGSPE